MNQDVDTRKLFTEVQNLWGEMRRLKAEIQELNKKLDRHATNQQHVRSAPIPAKNS